VGTALIRWARLFPTKYKPPSVIAMNLCVASQRQSQYHKLTESMLAVRSLSPQPRASVIMSACEMRH
jgi:hypothetical protein